MEEDRLKRFYSSLKFKIPVLILFLIIAALLLLRTYNSYRYHVEKKTRIMMDTFVTIYAVGPKNRVSEIVDHAFDRMEEINLKFNNLKPQSPLYDFNRKGTPISDPEVVRLVRQALEISRDTEGAFDITVAPLIALWGFYGDHPSLPDPKAIEECLKRVGFRYLVVNEGRLEKTRPDVEIDLGGIAKGYAVGQGLEVLKSEGLNSALIDAGGDVYALGKKGPNPWKVGIVDPRGDDLLGYVEVEDMAVVGSGDYERFFMKDGKRYHHIFDPRTGYPAEGLRGTTTLYSDPTLADAWNTAVFVMGPEAGFKAVERIPGMEVVMITSEGKVLLSPGLKEGLHSLPKEP